MIKGPVGSRGYGGGGIDSEARGGGERSRGWWCISTVGALGTLSFSSLKI